MSRPFCVALTGGVGCGKSLVSDLFAGHGAGVVDTDRIARELTGPSGQAMTAIAATFGAGFVAADGSLDRPRMRARVFADPDARRRLEAILHPLIRDHAAEQVAASPTPYVLLVVPLLVETGAYGDLTDRILVVDCDPEQQIERVVRRDGVDPGQARAMLASQAGREQRLAVADDIIANDGAAEHLRERVAQLHQAYLSAAADKMAARALR